MVFNWRYLNVARRISRVENKLFDNHVRYMKNKRRGLKEQPRKKPLDIEKKIKNTKKYEEKMHFDNLAKGELFMPESCKSKKLAMLCNRLFYFNINDSDLLDRYAKRASGIANSMNTKDMSLVLNTMAKFHHKNEQLLETFAKYIPSKLHKAVPQDISLILNAYAKFQFVDKNLFNRICEEIPHKIPYFEPPHIASIINAFVKLHIKDKIIINELTDEIVERIDDFDTKSLVNVINSFSKLNYGNEQKKNLWITFIKAVQKLENEFNFLETVLIINSLTKKIKNKKWYPFLNNLLNIHLLKENSINIKNAFLLPIACHAFAIRKYYSPHLWDITFVYFSNASNYVTLDTQHFSQLIYAFFVFHSEKCFSNKNHGDKTEVQQTHRIKEYNETNQSCGYNQTMKIFGTSDEGFTPNKQKENDILEHRDVTNNDVTNKDVTNKDITNKDITNKDVTNNDVTNNDVTNNDVTNKDVINREDIFLKTFIDVSCKRMEENQLNEKTISIIAYCFAKLQVRNKTFFISLSSYLIKEKLKLSPQSLSLLCYSYSKLLIKSEILFYFLSVQILQNINTFTKQGLSIILFSFAKLQIFNVQLFSFINKYINLYFDNCDYQECLIISNKYEQILKLMGEENLEEHRNQRGKYLIEFGNVKEELKKMSSALKEKIKSFEKKGLNMEYIKRKEEKEKQEENEDDDNDVEGEEELFSLFAHNKNIATDTSKEETDEIKTLVKSDTFMNNFYDTEDIKKKEQTLKIYSQMFLDNSKKDIQPKDSLSPSDANNYLINKKMNQNLLNVLDAQKNNREKKWNEENQSTKSLIDLMIDNENSNTNDNNKKIDSVNEHSIKSAEQMETEFIKSYIEGKESDIISDDAISKNGKGGRTSKKKKEKKKSRWSQMFEPTNDIDTLKNNWKNLYQK